MNELHRRSFLTGATALAVSSCWSRHPPADAPSVLVLLLDQLRAMSLPPYGDPNLHTPAISRLLDEGVRFETALAADPLCGPARASLLTGMYPAHVGVPNNDRPLAAGAPTLARSFRRAGYRVGYIGKWHLGPRGTQHITARHGFEDHFQGYNERYAYRDSFYYDGRDPTPKRPDPPDTFEPTYQTDQALALLERWKDRPFLLVVSYVPPHPPRDWRGDWSAHFPPGFPFGIDAETLTLRPNVPPWAEWEHPPPPGAAGRRNGPGARPFLRNYYGAILAMDREIARILDGLHALGLDERTLVVFTSDHGELGGSHGRYLKQKPYEESVRIPLAFRWRGTLAPGTRSTLFSQVDLHPTLAGLAGVAAPPSLHGRNLAACVRGVDERHEPVLICSHLTRKARRWWQIRTPRWSFTDYDADPDAALLFDVEADPYQLRNLASDPIHHGRVRELRTALRARRAALG